MLRLFIDGGDQSVQREISKQKLPSMQAKMNFYLGMYYDTVKSGASAKVCYEAFRELGIFNIMEYRLNEWILEDRGSPNPAKIAEANERNRN
jgi:hypothetical protein